VENFSFSPLSFNRFGFFKNSKPVKGYIAILYKKNSKSGKNKKKNDL
jgi:hypothetical protein